MKPNEIIVERLRKVLNLANGRNATQGEIEAAMARATEIAAKHNIDLASIEMTEDSKSNPIEIEVDEELRTSSKYQYPHHKFIFVIFEELFHVKAITHVGDGKIYRITLIGDPFDIAICKELFQWMEKVFTSTLSRAVSRGELTYSAAHTNGCYCGIYRGIMETNKWEEEKRQPEDANKMAMVVRSKEDAIDQRTAELFPHLKNHRSRATQFSSQAYSYGVKEGRKINLRQVSGNPRSNKLQ